MKLVALFLLSAVSFVTAAPTKTFDTREALDWSPALAEYYTKVENHIRDVKRSPDFKGLPFCDLSAAQMPTAPTALPQPESNYSLKHVAIGRGVQNYTCDINNITAVPSPVGAVANLYNVSCIAASSADLLSLLPELALQVSYPGYTLPPSKIQQSGVHYFSNSTTAVFDLSMAQSPGLGLAPCHKVANSTAPKTAVAGVDGSGDGAVAWLQLNTLAGTEGDLREVYRLNTAGGSPPKTCKGMPPSFSVDYAAEYWFWGTG